MPETRFELTLLVPSSYKGLSIIPDLRSRSSFSWSVTSGEIGAIFPDFPNLPPKSLEQIAQAAALPGVLVKIGELLPLSTRGFVGTLQCYLESLKACDTLNYCTGEGTLIGRPADCRSPSTCWRLCSTCIQIEGTAMSPIQRRELLGKLDVIWCPNFRSPCWN